MQIPGVYDSYMIVGSILITPVFRRTEHINSDSISRKYMYIITNPI